MDVTLLWFQCKNSDCNYVPFKTKKDKVKKAWKYGESIYKNARQRRFLKYVEGVYRYKNSNTRIEFVCDYGIILLYDEYDGGEFTNSHIAPIEAKEECETCIKRKQNERVLLQQ